MDIYDLLKNRLRKVSKSSKGFAIACCPSHKQGMERNPSFSVNLKNGGFLCYSCGIKGGLKELQRILNSPGHIELSKTFEEEGEKDDHIDEAVLAIFNKCPIQMLEDGFREEVLFKHQIGFDDVYNRITFPVRTPDGRLVAISGRGEDGVIPRYKVYTWDMLRGAAENTYSPTNKDWLFGAHTLPTELNEIYVVEGFKACLWLRQNELENTVATMGTMVKESQLQLLRRLADRVILVFDMDDSGVQSGKKLSQRLHKSGIPVTIKTYPTRQPDQLTKDQIHKLIKNN